ncbi:MAG: TetR/AcrR family transcriptional regulator [Myxococcota bacterium]
MKTKDEPRRTQAVRRQEMRRRLTSAAIACLDELGYAQTSITAVQNRAGVSRGALLHHFPNKRELIAATARAVLDSAIERMKRPGRSPDTVEELLVHYWRTVTDTPAGRAYVEILTACRTDEELREAVGQVIATWESGLTIATLERFVGRRITGPPEDVGALWGLCSSFLRGLLLDASLDAERSEQQVRLFARLLLVFEGQSVDTAQI